MNKFLKFNEDYERNIVKYTRKDGWLAILLFFIFITCYAVLAILNNKFKLVSDNITLVGLIFNILLVVVALLFVKLNKNSLDTIGLYKGKWKKSFIVGIVLAAIFFINNCGVYLMNGYKLIDIKEIAFFAIYFLSVSLCEELVFRGYINTRINGLIKNKWFAIVCSGILFVIMHFPYRMIAYGMSLETLTIGSFSWILDLFITHCILSFVYIKTNSIYGSVIPHWISNLSYSIVNK